MNKKRLPDNQIAVYQTPDGSINIEVLYANENIWLSQKRMAELFGCSSDNISLHLKNIYQEKELDMAATAEEFSVVQKEGKRKVSRAVTCYSLEAIIAVGYRVNSQRGTQFRWRNGYTGVCPARAHAEYSREVAAVIIGPCRPQRSGYQDWGKISA